MAKGKPAKRRTPVRNFPSRDDILKFVSQNPGRAGKREIARSFKVSPGDRVALKGLLREMADEGLIEKSGRRLQKPGQLPPVAVLEINGRDDDGELTAILAEREPDPGGAPHKILVIAPRRAAGEPPPGVGDRILARLEHDAQENLYRARPIKVLNQKRTRVLGVVRQTGEGLYQLEPIDKKARAAFRITAEELNGAKPGDLVSAEPLGGRRDGAPRVKIVEVLADQATEKAISLIALHDHDIPYIFPQGVLNEVGATQSPDHKGREDLTALPFVTIDPADAKDHDDAVYAEQHDEGDFTLWVAIADVAALVTPGSAMDREALKRGNSVYFPDRVVPMLPERISNDLCSLKEMVERPALVARMAFGADGHKQSASMHRATIRSAARLSYEDAQAAFDGNADERTRPLLKSALAPLKACYDALARARDDREPLDLDLPERRVILNDAGRVDRVIVPPRLDAHRMIEEFMIQANVAAAEILEDNRTPLIYRTHDTPSMAKMEALREFLETLDLSVPKTGRILPMHFNRILNHVKDTIHAPIVNEIVLRSQSQAEYAADNYGHFGLNLKRYGHFTSPIRRYADLIVHRALITACKLGDDGLDEKAATKLKDIAAAISLTERRAMAAERDTLDRLISAHLADRIGAAFHARISGVTRAGLFVRLNETGADGIIPLSRMDYDYFRLDEESRSVTGERTGETFQLGDSVEVKLVEAAPLAGALRFEMVSDGKPSNKALKARSARPGRHGRPHRGKGSKKRASAGKRKSR